MPEIVEADVGETCVLQYPLKLAGQRPGAHWLTALSGKYQALILVIIPKRLYFLKLPRQMAPQGIRGILGELYGPSLTVLWRLEDVAVSGQGERTPNLQFTGL